MSQATLGITLRLFFMGVGLSPVAAPAALGATNPPPTELERLVVKPLLWLTETSVMPAGTTREDAVPDTLDLAEVAREAVHGTAGDMTYLAVRLGQWGAGDYWEDVDQDVRNHLTEIQLRDTQRGFALYGDRSLERFRQSAPTRRVTRFVPAER